MRTTRQSTAGRLLATAVVTGWLLVGASACGTDGDDGGLPTAGGAADGAADGSSGDQDATADPDEAMLDFAACMREQGIDMPDPEPGEGVLFNGNEVDPEELGAAEEVCGEHLDEAIPDDADLQMSEEDKQAMLDLASCMRDRGYDFPDPTFDGGRVTQQLGEGQGIDPEDPAFRSDHDECADEAGLDMPVVQETR